MAFKVTRNEVLNLLVKDTGEDAAKLARFLQPDKLVPIDGKPLDLLKDKELPKDEMAKAKLLYDIVNKHMKYSKEGTGWGRGDAVWACENGHGNCTDFHSLFISLARAEKVPAKFEIGLRPAVAARLMATLVGIIAGPSFMSPARVGCPSIFRKRTNIQRRRSIISAI